MAPSAIPCGHTKQKTRALKQREIEKLVSDFVDAAERVRKTGADGVEIHASHGYLIQQFLSPRTNKRMDRYGGTPEKRMTFLLDIIKGIRERCGRDFPLSVRLTVDEFHKDGADRGITLDEGIRIAVALEKAGIDMINVSSGSYETMDSWLEPVSYEPGWRKHLAAEVRKNLSIPVLAASLIKTPEQAEKQISEGYQDLAAIGRGQLADPLWTEKAMMGKSHLIRRCISCLNCFESLNRNGAAGLPLECSLNPRLGFEYCGNNRPEKKRDGKAVVVGAGPAGLSAALFLSDGFDNVEIYERDSRPGGQLKLAEIPPLKEKISWFYTDAIANLEERGVKIHFNREITPEDLDKIKPDVLVLATGGRPVKPPIDGVDGKDVYLYSEILTGEKRVSGGRVAVIGSGMSGLETAEFLSDGNKSVIVVEMQDRIGPGIYSQNLNDVTARLEKNGVEFMVNRKLAAIGKERITLDNLKTGKRESVAADSVVLALGVKSERELSDMLKDSFPHLICVGDALTPGRIFDAVHGACEKIGSVL